MSSSGSSPASSKGILKKSASKSKKSGIAWDEPTIAEHDKDRGTRMKIDEPDTPFEHGAASDLADELSLPSSAPTTTASQWDAMDAMAATVAAEGDATAAAPATAEDDEWADSDDEADAQGDSRKRGAPAADAEAEAAEKARFEAARRAHYAEEMRKVKEMMRSGAMDDDDEDEDEDEDGDAGTSQSNSSST